MPLDLRDLLAALLRLRGAILDFGVPFVAAQMVVSLVATVPWLTKVVPPPLRAWLAPAELRSRIGQATTEQEPLRIASSIAGLPSLLVALPLGPLYVLAKLGGAIVVGGLLALWRPTWSSRQADAGTDETAPGPGDALLTLLSDLAAPFFISAVLGGVIVSLVPREIVLALVGPGRSWGPAIAAWLAFPFRAIAGTELPLASALLVAGGSPGSAVALLVAAPMLHYDSLRRQATAPGGFVLTALVWLVATVLGLAVDLLPR